MRVEYVAKARKVTKESCGNCYKPIEVGQGYRYLQFWGYRKVRHIGCGNFLGSEMTSSEPVAEARRAGEHILDWCEEAEHAEIGKLENPDVEGMLEDAANMVESAAQMFEEAADNIEDGFGTSTPMSEEMREKASDCEEWADSIRSIEYNIDAWEDFLEDNQDHDEIGVTIDMLWREWVEKTISDLHEVATECPV